MYQKKNLAHSVGDVIQYEPFGGGIRTVVVTGKDRIPKPLPLSQSGCRRTRACRS